MPIHHYTIGFHYVSPEALHQDEDVFKCDGMSICDAVNKWIDYCIRQGYVGFYMDSYIETPS